MSDLLDRDAAIRVLAAEVCKHALAYKRCFDSDETSDDVFNEIGELLEPKIVELQTLLALPLAAPATPQSTQFTCEIHGPCYETYCTRCREAAAPVAPTAPTDHTIKILWSNTYNADDWTHIIGFARAVLAARLDPEAQPMRQHGDGWMFTDEHGNVWGLMRTGLMHTPLAIDIIERGPSVQPAPPPDDRQA